MVYLSTYQHIMIVDKRKRVIDMSRVIGRINDWDTILLVERTWNYTHVRLDYKGRELEIELNKDKVKQLIKMLEESIK